MGGNKSRSLVLRGLYGLVYKKSGMMHTQGDQTLRGDEVAIYVMLSPPWSVEDYLAHFWVFLQ